MIHILNVVDRIGQVIVLGVMIFFTHYFWIYMQKIGKMGTVSNTMGFKMTLPMTFVFIGCGLIILHTIFNILLPREYWFGAEKPAATIEEEEA
ncbi:MAG: TRAP transporter small permease subunit [Dysosmobacter sp.]|uniref:TRAP transporter small permease subunit n=1 Tax=uncultured Oscillibacter sp. TaxID=876091 RepID=UPI00261893D0|nr:TRAP transporter small permease subunit [uncultured Oscillibacter sp.]MCX4371479.1 TRAP transporter small permease subunit [Dysosmobacter sp.]